MSSVGWEEQIELRIETSQSGRLHSSRDSTSKDRQRDVTLLALNLYFVNAPSKCLLEVNFSKLAILYAAVVGEVEGI